MDRDTVLGAWRLVERIGSGGMGEVWRVAGEAGEAALKVLRDPYARPDELRRFEREAMALRELQHENVVRALDFGRSEDGQLFLAMELLQGESLSTRLRRRILLPVADVLDIGVQAAAGLGAAHDAGLVHRDVKPGNLFLTTDGTVKVLDFGVALGDSGEMDLGRLTQTGVVVGTPSYMAPEQASGDRSEDERTDIWGLGAVLYRCLAGRPPFRAGGHRLGELFRIVHEKPDRLPSTLPASVREIVARALSKDPDERFGSMAELQVALQEVPPDDAAGTLSPRTRRAAAATSAADGAPTLVETPRQLAETSDTGVLTEEVRQVSAVVAQGIQERSAVDGLLALIHKSGGIGSAMRGRWVVGVFGGAEWAGDEAERAVRVALAGRRYASWLGVGTGKAVIDAASRGVVTGAALEAATQALRNAEIDAADVTLRVDGGRVLGTVGACRETLRRVRGGFDILGVRVLSEKTGLRPIGVRDVGGVEIPLLGRDTELRRLQDVVERAADDGMAESALILGPPGIGKSRMRHELLRWLESHSRDFKYLEGRAEATRTFSSHAMIRDVLRLRAGLPEGSSVDEARRRIESMVVAAGVEERKRRGTAEFIGELMGVPFPDNDHLRTARGDPEVMGDRIRLAVGDLFEAWTRQSPVVLALEDLQWSDSASLALVEFLLLRLYERPLAVVATARPELLTERPDALPDAERIELRELTTRDVGAIVERILGCAEAAVVERAAGNPYFAEELSLAVREGADLEALPPTVEGAVQARLDKLTTGEKDLLKRAAVIGRRFWAEAVESLGAQRARRALASLRRRDLVVPRPDTRLAGCREWFFRHAVVREVALGMLTDGQRRALHRLAAQWLGARADAPPDEVAWHFDAAGDPEQAAEHWVRAVHAADSRGDSTRVIELGDRLLGVHDPGAAVPLSPEEEYALRVRRLIAFFWTGDMKREAVELQALDLLEAEAGERFDLALRAELRRRQTLSLSRRGHSAEAVAVGLEAVRLADETGIPAEASRSRSRLAMGLAEAGRLEEAARFATEAAEWAARTDDPGVQGYAWFARAYTRSTRGDLTEAYHAYRAARQESERAGAIRVATMAAMNEGVIQAALGDMAGACEALERVVEAARGLGLRPTEGWALHNLGLARALNGDLQGGRRDEDAALAVAAGTSDGRLDAVAHAYRSFIALMEEDVPLALELGERALELSIGRRASMELSARTVLAMALLAAGRNADALECIQAALAERDTLGGMAELEVDLLFAHHDALRALGLEEEAKAAAVTAVECYQQKLAKIEDPHFRETFTRNMPAHARAAKLLERGS